MTMMEPRVAQRRKNVSEDRARRRLRWVLIVIAMITAVAFGLWLIKSPVLSIRSIDVTGAQRSDPMSDIIALGYGNGTPTIDVDAGLIRRRIERNPWVSSADVRVGWPGSITVAVTERRPVAPARAGDGWVILSASSTVLQAVPEPSTDRVVIDIDLGGVDVGDTIDDPLVRGAIDFAAALREDLQAGARVTAQGDGLFATVAGHTIRLGRPKDIAAKASVIAALIDQGIDPDAPTDVIAPTRPAVPNPEPVVEAQQ